jgi:hypothetical protein
VVGVMSSGFTSKLKVVAKLFSVDACVTLRFEK